MYESNYDSFEFIFQETSLLDNQPWNKGHGLYCELYPQKRRRIACLSRKLQATLEFIQTVLLWLVPSLFSCCGWLWFAFLFVAETISTFQFPSAFSLPYFLSIEFKSEGISCPTISAQLLHFWESASDMIIWSSLLFISSLVFPEPERTCTSVFFFAFNFRMEQNSVTNSSNAGANLRKEDIRQMIERQDMNEEVQKYFGFLWQILAFSILDSKQLPFALLHCEGWCHAILVWSQSKFILDIRIHQWCWI